MPRPLDPVDADQQESLATVPEDLKGCPADQQQPSLRRGRLPASHPDQVFELCIALIADTADLA
jgi:hypothetical protein